ncbi:MAG: UTRA domain-containing protein [Leptotrichiaceae bacterium]|nr:UTRA domain-containing protein [Leptotrichiaceae bacterium]MBP6281155.1 UTRA domain-containing protein [Leptotrichiaceae bacterium]MBP7100867.1 UTRA domain-containing protein [Leptotrichiaceae bacterium]MBP7739482.1 UTRA domain-containing protein [Leptotrichiaceae bacterium]MBP9629799.1 UTRA domain-containing protein [Leptotrichiaceae bacterium]
MSKYKEVYNDIKEEIKNGNLKSGEFLESEADLAKKYSYSKDTIRKALSMLELDGYIQKVKGKNSLVLGHGRLKNVYLSFIQTSSELNKMEELNIKTDLISLYIVQGEEELMDIFSVSEDSDFYKIVRTRSLDNERIELDHLYFDRRIVPFLNKNIAEKSIYEYLENELNLKISHSRREIKFRYANEEENKNLDLGNYNMVVVIESLTYLSNGSLFQYGYTSYRPDKFTFTTVAKR